MRLTIAVLHGDVTDIHYRPGWWAYDNLRERLRDGSFTADGGDGRAGTDRWTELGRKTFRDTFTVSVPGTDSSTGTGTGTDAAPMTVDGLVRLCLDQARAQRGIVPGPDTRRIWLADAVTHAALQPEELLDAAGVTDGDPLVLCIEQPARAMYALAPAPNPAELIRRLQLAENATAPDDGPRLWGVLLYTDADIELATYVRTHFDDLNALSGPSTRVFVIERNADWSRAKPYWRRHLEPELYRVLSTMRWLQWQPYDPQGAYEIASLLGLNPALLPCLVLFHATEGPLHQGEKIVFRLDDASPASFRSLFGGIASALRPANDETLPDLAKLMERGRPSFAPVPPGSTPETALRRLAAPAPGQGPDSAAFARVRAAADSIRAALRPAEPVRPDHTHTFALHNCRVVVTSGASVSENFYFQGTNTTFINRPKDTVVRDFQHTYASGLGGDELTRLLELVLSSRDLSDADREEAAGAVHDLARITTAPEPDAPQVRTRLERLRELLAGGADIAQPALAIVASVATLFAG
ncbi:hypothetical protein [Streptomyces sp. NPDC055709]